MISRKFYLFLIIFFFQFGFSQDQNEVVNDSIVKEKKWNFTVDLASRYIWRGQSWGGDYAVIQPTIVYNFNDKFSIGTWATSNFKKDYFYSDGTSVKGYHELDFFLSYKVSNVFTIELWDYYWPTVSKVEGIDNSYFNYSDDGVKSVDLMVIADFSEIWLPFKITASTLIGGNDFQFDDNGENPKRNFTTYTEISYTEVVLDKIEITGVIGAVLNNKAGYYTYSNYDKPSFCNLNLKASYLFSYKDKIEFPVWLSYFHNAATENTEVFGKNFLVFGTTIAF